MTWERGRWRREKCLSPAPARFSHFFLLNDSSPLSRSLEQAIYFLVHCTLSLYKDSSRNIKRILTYTTVPFWFSFILSSLGETKNPSLPVSFLSLAHASIVADQVFNYDDRRNDRLNMKNKNVHFATYLLLLSSRLFAAALVTASYNTGL